MKKMLVIPDYIFGADGWETERSYFHNFSYRAEVKGWKLVHIRDQLSIDEIDCVFAPNYAKYLDKIHNFNIYEKIIKNGNIKKISAIFEAPSRRPDLWDYTQWFDFCISFSKKPKKHCQCEHIESPYPYNFSENKCNYHEWRSRDNLVWVSSNNWFRGFDSLSQRRLQDFNYFSKILGGKIALYGKGWDRESPSLYGPIPVIGMFQTRMNKRQYNNIIRYWLGPVENKFETISNYKFCFSYENTDNYPGYVTEKVFDAWMAGCIPIYWGDREFEELYQDLMICPRNIGIDKSVEIMREIDEEKALYIQSKFESITKAGKFAQFSHEHFQDKLLDTAESLV
jgi:alpha(1,3/1,4) fucosyltransferase